MIILNYFLQIHLLKGEVILGMEGTAATKTTTTKSIRSTTAEQTKRRPPRFFFWTLSLGLEINFYDYFNY